MRQGCLSYEGIRSLEKSGAGAAVMSRDVWNDRVCPLETRGKCSLEKSALGVVRQTTALDRKSGPPAASGRETTSGPQSPTSLFPNPKSGAADGMKEASPRDAQD